VILRGNLTDWSFVRLGRLARLPSAKLAAATSLRSSAFRRGLRVRDARVASVRGSTPRRGRVGRETGVAGSAFASRVWRNAATGCEGERGARLQLCRCSSARSRRSAARPGLAPAGSIAGAVQLSRARRTGELLYPREWPLAHHELSYLLPHLLKSRRGRIDTYFTRVYNPSGRTPMARCRIERCRTNSWSVATPCCRRLEPLRWATRRNATT
jgi:hypothetical protein